jgi:hypothetical protein
VIFLGEENYEFGKCGVFCEMCPTGNGRIAELAKELSWLIKGSYSWLEDSLDFRLEDLRKGLEWLSKEDCPTCKNIKEPWCEVLKCQKIRQISNCLLCDEFLTCSRTSYQRDRYPFVIKHYQRVKEIGIESHYDEERKKAREGITLNDIRKW